MPKAHKIFSIKKIKEEKLPDPGKRDHPTTRGIRTIRKEHREELEDEECREHCLLDILTAVTVTTTWPLWLLPRDCTHRTDGGLIGINGSAGMCVA